MAEKTVRGQFLWHDLMTPDTSGAHAFYSKALGWKSEPWQQDPSYSMFAAPSGPLGGSVALPAGTPHWLHYIGTEDIDATVQQAAGLGGSVRMEITSLPGGGRYAVLADPQGAAFGVYDSESAQVPDGEPRRGEFSWHELATGDCQAAFEFYSALFGWEKLAEHEMDAMGVYLIFGRDGRRLGGMFNKSPEMRGEPAWLGYVRVRNVHQTVDKVKAARGTLINGPMEVPGGDWIAQFTDPYGAMFAAHALASDMKAASPAATPAASAAAEPAAAAPATAKPAARKPARKAAPQSAKKKAKKKAAKKPARKAAKKAPARRKAGPKRKAAAKKKSAAKSARRPARTAARTAKQGRKQAAAKKKRPAGKKKAAGKKTAGKKTAGKKKRAGAPRKAK